MEWGNRHIISPYRAANYSSQIKKPFPQGEKAIMKKKKSREWYERFILNK
jgi:uncharacterized protein YgiM (DUF1202 family)